MSAADALLRSIEPDERDRPVQLLKCAGLVERLTGHRPHRSALHRWATREAEPRLSCFVVPGVGRMTTAALLARFFCELGAARAESVPAPARRPAARRRRAAR